jgi:ABC-type multidrug transport system ATPase subunit
MQHKKSFILILFDSIIKFQDIHQEGLTVHEVLMYAADLKLGFNDVTKQQKYDIIGEIISILRLEKAVHTNTSNLSGGELKR